MSRARKSPRGNPAARPKDKPWSPFVRCQQIPTGEWIWENSRFVVIVATRGEASLGWDGIEGDHDAHLSFRRQDRAADRITWRDVQRLKAELCGSEAEAIEVYPAESRTLDGANQRHLWVWRADNPARPRYGFHTGRQVGDGDRVRAMLADPVHGPVMAITLAASGATVDQLRGAVNDPFEDGVDVNLGHEGLIW